MNTNRDHFQLKLSDELLPLANDLFVKSKETLTTELTDLVRLV